MYSSNKYTSCCQECSCDSSCIMFGTCCPDYDVPDDVKITQQPTCAPVRRIMNTDSHLDFETAAVFYRFVDFCQKTTDDSDVSYQLCYHPANLVDHIPVVTKAGDKVFRNEHCAKCNGYDNIVFWQLFVGSDCSHIIDKTFKSVIDRDKFIRENCILSAIPPTFLRSGLVQCPNPDNINTECNKTGRWLKYEKDILTNCEKTFPVFTSNGFFLPKSKLAGLALSNPICYLCNFPRPSVSDVCIGGVGQIKTSQASLIVLIRHIEKHDKKTVKENICSSSEVFDPYLVSEKKMKTPVAQDTNANQFVSGSNLFFVAIFCIRYTTCSKLFR